MGWIEKLLSQDEINQPCNAGMLAPDGRCKTLDASGDGYVRGETCVTLLLEDMDTVDHTAAILKASAVNQAGFYF